MRVDATDCTRPPGSRTDGASLTRAQHLRTRSRVTCDSGLSRVHANQTASNLNATVNCRCVPAMDHLLPRFYTRAYLGVHFSGRSPCHGSPALTVQHSTDLSRYHSAPGGISTSPKVLVLTYVTSGLAKASFASISFEPSGVKQRASAPLRDNLPHQLGHSPPTTPPAPRLSMSTPNTSSAS